MGRSLKLNYLYNLLYQLTAVLLPLITMPYVSRVLGVEGIGINSFTNANTQYFILAGSLGIGIYATKKIAIVKDDKSKLKQTFYEIFSLQCLGCLLAYVVFILTLGTGDSLSLYYFLQGIFILAAAIDISWYFLGIEDFKKASLRSFVVKVCSVVLIFTFVRTADDLWKYIFINSGSIFVGQLIMWCYVDKEVLKGKTSKSLNIFHHIRPAIIMFIPQIASQVYMVVDKTMTGILTNTMEVGYYDQSQKIVRLLLAIVTSLGMVMLPRIASLFENGREEEVKEYLMKAFSMVSFLAIPITFGILAISDRLIPMFFGNQYMPVVPLTNVASWMVIIIGFGNVFGTQYLLATGKNAKYTLSVIVGAIINLVLNLILIPKLFAMGAVISTLTAESIIAIIQCIYARKIINKGWILSTYKYWIAGILMFIVVRELDILNLRRSIGVFIHIGVGGATYLITLFILKDKLMIDTAKGLLDKVKGKFR